MRTVLEKCNKLLTSCLFFSGEQFETHYSFGFFAVRIWSVDVHGTGKIWCTQTIVLCARVSNWNVFFEKGNTSSRRTFRSEKFFHIHFMCSDNHRIRYHIFSLLHMMPCRRAFPKRAPSALEVYTVLLGSISQLIFCNGNSAEYFANGMYWNWDGNDPIVAHLYAFPSFKKRPP